MKRKIGEIEFETPFFLAPMAGITDSPMRRLCRRMGASLVYSEMISAKGLYYSERNTEPLLFATDDEKPLAYQIFGSDPFFMGYAAKKLECRENVIIDINIGCPVPKVVKNGEGSALMQNPKLIYDIVREIKKNTSKLVTAKIRLGMDDMAKNYEEVASSLEDAGVSAIALHARTRKQYYSGFADWDAIKRLVLKCKVPIIGNGDVDSYEKARQMMEETGCAFVMVGRASFGNPWIFRELNQEYLGNDAYNKNISRDEMIETILSHLDDLIEIKGEYKAVREMRKHIAAYTKGISGSASFRNEINSVVDVSKLKEMVKLIR